MSNKAKSHRDDVHTDCKLTIDAERIEGHPMFLRMELATADGDGFKVEVATTTGGGLVVVTYTRDDDDGKWTSYVLTPKALVEAVIAMEESRDAEQG